jgi:hypothetical protein
MTTNQPYDPYLEPDDESNPAPTPSGSVGSTGQSTGPHLHVESKKPRRWPWIAGIVAALVVGVTIGTAGQTEPTAGEPEVVTDTVTETVTETVNVEVVPQECKDLVDSLRAYVDITLGALSQMADILDQDGYMIVDEYVDIVDEATGFVNDNPGQFHSTACGV